MQDGQRLTKPLPWVAPALWSSNEVIARLSETPLLFTPAAAWLMLLAAVLPGF